MKFTLELSLGIIAGDQKRELEDFIGSEHFTQRKNYDEYYVKPNELEVDLELEDLMKLAESFEVAVTIDRIRLESGW